MLGCVAFHCFTRAASAAFGLAQSHSVSVIGEDAEDLRWRDGADSAVDTTTRTTTRTKTPAAAARAKERLKVRLARDII